MAYHITIREPQTANRRDRQMTYYSGAKQKRVTVIAGIIGKDKTGKVTYYRNRIKNYKNVTPSSVKRIFQLCLNQE